MMIRLISVSVVVILAEVAFSTQEQSKCVFIPKPKAFPVTKNLTDWNKKFPEYDPPEWTVPCEEELCDKMRPEHITFGEEWDGVDRRRAKSCFIKPKYKVSKLGRPMNPAGRTGIAGRGELPKWGPNHLMKLMLHRKDKDNDYSLQSGDLFPEIFVNSPSSHWFDQKMENRLQQTMTYTYRSLEAAEKAIRNAEKKSKRLIRGSIPHPKNTDNAWIELHFRYVECSDHESFCKAMAAEFEGRGFHWTKINKTSTPEGRKKAELKQTIEKDILLRYSAFCRLLMKENSITRLPAVFGLSTISIGIPIGILAAVLFTVTASTVPILFFVLVGIGALEVIILSGYSVVWRTCS